MEVTVCVLARCMTVPQAPVAPSIPGGLMTARYSVTRAQAAPGSLLVRTRMKRTLDEDTKTFLLWLQVFFRALGSGYVARALGVRVANSGKYPWGSFTTSQTHTKPSLLRSDYLETLRLLYLTDDPGMSNSADYLAELRLPGAVYTCLLYTSPSPRDS